MIANGRLGVEPRVPEKNHVLLFKRLLAAHSDLYDQAYRYRRVMMRSVDSGKKFVRAHQLLADRIIARDIPGSQAMLTAHLRSTMDYVYPPGSES